MTSPSETQVSETIVLCDLLHTSTASLYVETEASTEKNSICYNVWIGSDICMAMIVSRGRGTPIKDFVVPYFGVKWRFLVCRRKLSIKRSTALSQKIMIGDNVLFKSW